MIKKITEYLNSVREEVILYTGLNYNIDEIGSLDTCDIFVLFPEIT